MQEGEKLYLLSKGPNTTISYSLNEETRGRTTMLAVDKQPSTVMQFRFEDPRHIAYGPIEIGLSEDAPIFGSTSAFILVAYVCLLYWTLLAILYVRIITAKIEFDSGRQPKESGHGKEQVEWWKLL